MARFHAMHGTTALLATTVSDSPEALRAAVEGVAAAASAPRRGGAVVLGSHLEGPVDRPFESGGAVRPGTSPAVSNRA